MKEHTYRKEAKSKRLTTKTRTKWRNGTYLDKRTRDERKRTPLGGADSKCRCDQQTRGQDIIKTFPKSSKSKKGKGIDSLTTYHLRDGKRLPSWIADAITLRSEGQARSRPTKGRMLSLPDIKEARHNSTTTLAPDRRVRKPKTEWEAASRQEGMEKRNALDSRERHAFDMSS